MKKCKIIVLFVLLVSMISGCTENRNKEMDVKSMHGVEDSLEELLTTTTNLKYGGNIKNIRVADVNVLEKSCFVTFLFGKDSVNWHAVMYAEKMPDDNYELGFLDGTVRPAQTIYTEIAIGVEGYPASVTAVSDNGEVLFEKKY
ncbi:hypothetical protein L5D93_11285 [Paenibacillus thiaminolyticus]|nr:hypothetical protein [Paenibacillus thiaminolyticus]